MKNRNPLFAAGTLAAAVVAVLAAQAANSTHAPQVAAVTNIGAAASAAATRSSSMAMRRQLPNARTAREGGDRLIVKYRAGSLAARGFSAATNAVDSAAARAGLAVARGTTNAAPGAQHLRRLAIGADVVRLSRNLNATETAALLAQLRSDPSVEYAQPDAIKHAYFVPNDPRLDLQWHYTHPTTGIRATDAWNASRGEGAVVAVLDTGHVDHADLDANLVPGYDFIIDTQVAGDGDGRDADAHDPGDFYGGYASSWHGTHVSGTVAAVTDNGLGVAGVAFGARVQPVRVLGRGGGYTSDIADAVVWASGGQVAGVPDNATPAEVLNLSLGGDGSCSSDQAMQAAIDSALSRGTVVVVAAGNDNDDAAFHSPASCRGVITVGASGIDGARSYFSNYGGTVTLSAPGGNATSGSDPDDRWIWSLGNSGSTTPVASPGGDVLVGMIGTSMASPHVAGVVALMQTAAVAAGQPALTPVQVKSILRSTAIPFTVQPPTSKPQGPGIVDAAAAVQAAMLEQGGEDAMVLANRAPETGLTGAAGDSLLYRITVPAGRTSLNLRTYGGSGNVSIHVAYDRAPTAADYDRKSAKPGNSEAVVITNPVAGDYYLRVTGETAFGGVSALGLY